MFDKYILTKLHFTAVYFIIDTFSYNAGYQISWTVPNATMRALPSPLPIKIQNTHAYKQFVIPLP